MEAEKPQTGGQGDRTITLLGGDDHRLKSDLKMLQRAVREEWDIPTDLRKEAVARLRTIIRKPTVEVLTKQGGTFAAESTADQNAIGAAAVLERMVKTNQADRHHVEDLAADANKPAASPAAIVVVDARSGETREVRGLGEFYRNTEAPVPSATLPSPDAGGPQAVVRPPPLATGARPAPTAVPLPAPDVPGPVAE